VDGWLTSKVKRVCFNRVKRTSGVDGVVLDTPAARWRQAQQLNVKDYEPQPLRRIYIPNKNGKCMPVRNPRFFPQPRPIWRSSSGNGAIPDAAKPPRALYGAFPRLAPCALKLACTVLWGPGQPQRRPATRLSVMHVSANKDSGARWGAHNVQTLSC